MKYKIQGFTLIELMIAVAIIGILAAIAYPTYQTQVLKSRRSEAKATLHEISQQLERCYTTFRAYNNAGCVVVTAGTPNTVNQPSSNGYYQISSIDSTTTTETLATETFTLHATPQNAQANDACGTFTLTNTGLQGVTGGSLTANDCWR